MTKYSRIIVGIILSTAMISQTVKAQEAVAKKSLTRGKMWICCLPNGSLERDVTTMHNWLTNYPGHYEADNPIAGGWDGTRIFNVAQLEGENVGWQYRNFLTHNHVYAVEQTKLIKNYNLPNPNLPEEYIEGVIGSFKNDRLGNRHMAYEIEAKTMVWSLPRYDDFVIIECKLTNTDDVAFENFYYSRMLNPTGPDNPLSATYDVEYMWDDEISDDVGFIFYDDTSLPPETKGDSSIYSIFPGNITGDRGDPGNIEMENSRDMKLYSPALYAFTFYKDRLTPNKNGERKVWRNIFSRSSDAPLADRYPGHESLATYSGLTNILKDEQPEMGWREAHALHKEGDIAGSLWERSPRYVYTIGPYDIAPGESIEWIEIFVAGQMDRNISILGDTTATLHFVADGLVNLKENWNAVEELIRNNYAITKDIPPPTPATTPLRMGEIEIVAEPASAKINDELKAGVNLIWEPVHIGYRDPLTGDEDFAGYRVYRSNISIEGPWQLVNTIPIEEIDNYLQDGMVNFFQETKISIPYRYCITSFDNDGNESAKTAFNLDPVAARAFATNDLDQVRVVPNPFRQESGFRKGSGESKRLAFINIPEKCIIRIYTVALDLVRTISHESGGETTWGSNNDKYKDYLLTDFAMNVSPGIYIYHIESRVEGHEGDSKVGKIFIIK
ncbi:hypothetical protein GF337_15275 [candidate division KSB1 bacterium]|nr:hypothetical protein [candidate division KSB1 bacterium]